MTLLLLSAAAAWYMTGVAWLVQLVVYPSFALVAPADWPAHHAAHSRRITWVVLPGMVVELASAVWIAVATPSGVPAELAWAGAALAASTWLLTFLVAVPEHTRLGDGHDLAGVQRLVRGHGWRTAAWSAHGVVAALLLAAA